MGGGRLSAEATFMGFTESASQSEFAIQPGAGVDIHLTDRLAARVQADWRRFFSADDKLGVEDSDEFRFALGVVVGLGSR